VGKVLLAHAPDDIQAHALANLTSMTPYTIIQPGRLRAEIRRAHREGSRRPARSSLVLAPAAGVD